MNRDAKLLNKLVANQTQQYIKRFSMIKWDSPQGMQDFSISDNQLFMIKALQEVGTEGKYLIIMKAIYDKPTANIILNGEKQNAFLLRSGIIQRFPLSTLLLT